MTDIRKILVPIDFNEASRKAAVFGAALSKEFEAKLLLAHVVEVTPAAAALMSEPILRGLSEQAHGKLEALTAEVAPGDVSSRVIVASGNVADDLLTTMSQEPVDLVVMGTHGRRGFERWILGSVTERILRKAPVPILTVSHVEDVNLPDSLTEGRILYATDLSGNSVKGLEAAYGWARRFAAELKILNVVLPLETGRGKAAAAGLSEAERELARAVPDSIQVDPKVRLEVAEGAPHEVILEDAEKWRADLIVIHLRGRSHRDRTLIGSTAERVVRGATRPVLSIPVLDL